MSKAVITLDSKDFEERGFCPFCDHEQLRRVGPDLPLLPSTESCAAGDVLVAPSVAAARRLLECLRCSGWFVSTIPTPEATLRINDAPSYVEQLLPDPNRHSFERGWQAIAARASGGRILDVGSSGGTFLRGLSKGWHKVALEPSASASLALSFADQLIVSELESLDSAATESFDFVTLFDVAEHIRRPSEAFRKLAQITNPGGWIIIETGDRDSRAAAAGPLWYYVRYLSHFVFYNRRVLERLLANSGFELELFSQVHHSNPTLAATLQQIPRQVAYRILTLNKSKPENWVRIAALLSRVGAAPAGWHPDHFFAVARRLAN